MHKEFTDFSEIIDKYTDKSVTAFVTVSYKMPYILVKLKLDDVLPSLSERVDTIYTTSRFADNLIIRYCYENNINVKVFDFYNYAKPQFQFNRLPKKIYKFIGICSKRTNLFNSFHKFYSHFTETIILDV